MKNNPKSINFAGLILVFAFIIMACGQDETVSEEIAINQDETTSDNQNETTSEEITSDFEGITVKQLQYINQAEQISDGIYDIAEDVYTLDEFSVIGKSTYTSDFLPDCVSVSTAETETSKKKTIDFGERCELKNGNVLSGIINIIYNSDMEKPSKTIILELDNFVFNAVAIEGGANIVRIRGNENFNLNQSADITRIYSATWPDGEKVSISGTKVYTWREGFGSGFWEDNVYETLVKGIYTNTAGNVWYTTTTKKTRIEMSCEFIVSGAISILKSSLRTELDFGDGSCDAKGILTKPDGTKEEITLIPSI